ncbi:MAG: glycoside hydrolase family 2 protein [Sedimentisphaeraceae bacterium JB056]
MFTYNRESIDLNGKWKFNPDPMQRCRQQKWWQNKPQNNNFFPCWDVEGFWDIEVPGTWKKQIEELKWYDGHAVYMRDFEIDEIPADSEAFLVFDGVVYTSEIYLNGQSVGSHDWGYSPFNFRVTDILQETNRLFVLVENLHKEDRVPGTRYDWNNDGGIINGVKLVFVPKVYVKNFRTQTTIEAGQVHIDFEVLLDCRDRSSYEDVTFEIPELGVSQTVSVAAANWECGSVSIDVDKIDLWTPENPKLYETVVKTRFEILTDKIGYRQISTSGSDILLNGKPIHLYGVCVHSEFADTGRSATAQGISEMIARAKELGANFLRCAHYPYAEMFGRMMDEAGLMWWQEVPVYWVPQIDDVPHMKEQALGMLSDAIVRDWNRSSLIIWSTSNECAHGFENGVHTPGREEYDYWFEAADMIRAMDPGRLISGAECQTHETMSLSSGFKIGDEFDHQIKSQRWRAAHPDEFYEMYDILGANLYVTEPGDGLIAYHKLVDILKPYNKPIVISEFGSMSVLGANSDPEKVGNEDFHCLMLREAYKSFRELPEIKGWCPWCLMDVRVPLHWRWYNKGKGVFRYGLMDENWNKKKAFEIVAEENGELRKIFEADR